MQHSLSKLTSHKHFRLDSGLSEDGAERAFRDIAGMIGNGGIAAYFRIESDFMRACRLAVEFEAQLLQAPDDLPIAEAGQSPHQAFTIIG
ncbi:MAG: hypothetical protein ACYCZS_07850 [Thiobacillus sp.]